jgi:hypothetical protein
MNPSFPPEGCNVLIKNPNSDSWEVAYYLDGNWWIGATHQSGDINIDYTPSEWKTNE